LSLSAALSELAAVWTFRDCKPPDKIQDFSVVEIFCWSRKFVRCSDATVPALENAIDQGIAVVTIDNKVKFGQDSCLPGNEQ
jgi:hypothetical protein